MPLTIEPTDIVEEVLTLQNQINDSGAGTTPYTEIPIRSSVLTPEAMEKKFIVQALKLCYSNRTEAAQKLGISRRTLHRKLKEYQIENL